MPVASVKTKWVNGNLVYYQNGYDYRWFDIIGPTAVKMLEDFQYTKISAADTLAGWTTTLVEAGAGESTAALVSGSDGGELLLTTDAAENDGLNLQVLGEAFKFETAKPLYFGCKFKISEATQSDILVGLCITDTDLLGGMTDGVYFRKVDGATSLLFFAEKDSTELPAGGVTIQTVAADTFYTVEFFWDGTKLTPYVNGVAKTEVTTGWPDDEYLTPSIHFLTGAASAITCNVDWIRVIQAK